MPSETTKSKQVKVKPIPVRFTEDQVIKLRKAASKAGISVAELVRVGALTLSAKPSVQVVNLRCAYNRNQA